MATCTIIEEVSTELAAYSEVPISFTVSQRLRVDLIDGGLGGVSTQNPSGRSALCKGL